MAPQWTGHLTFGLVSIGVELRRSAEKRRVPLHEVHRADGGRIRHVRHCTVCDRDVETYQTARGYTAPHGHRVILSDEDLSTLPLPSQRVLDLQAFVAADAIEPVRRVGVSYYVTPRSGPAHKPYRLLQQTMVDRAQVGVVRITVGTREYPAVLRPYHGILLLDLLHWPAAMRPPPIRPRPQTATHRHEVDLMLRLGEAMSRGFDLAEQHDPYRKALQAVADAAKAAYYPPPPGQGQAPTGLPQLIDALNASIAEQEKGRRKPAAGAPPLPPEEG